MKDLFLLLPFHWHFLCSSWINRISKSATGSNTFASYSRSSCSAHPIWQSGDNPAASPTAPERRWLVYHWSKGGHTADGQWALLAASRHHRAPPRATSAAPNCTSRHSCEMLITKCSTAEQASVNAGHPSLVGRQEAETLFLLLLSSLLPHYGEFLVPTYAEVEIQNKPQKPMCWCQNARAEPKRKPVAGWGSAPRGKQGCQSYSLSQPPPGLIAVEVGLVVLPVVGGKAQNSRLCSSDLYTSVTPGSFEGVFLLSSGIAAAVKSLLKCLQLGL